MLLHLLTLIILQTGIAVASDWSQVDPEIESKATKLVIEAVLEDVRNSQHRAQNYRACINLNEGIDTVEFENAQSWLKGKKGMSSKIFCNHKVRDLKNRINENLPYLRRLAIIQNCMDTSSSRMSYGVPYGRFYRRSQFNKSDEKLSETLANSVNCNFIITDGKMRNLIHDMPSYEGITELELRDAYLMYDARRSYSAKAIYDAKQSLPRQPFAEAQYDFPTTYSKKYGENYSPETNNPFVAKYLDSIESLKSSGLWDQHPCNSGICSEQLYFSHIFGDKSLDLTALPILAFLISPNPSNKDLVSAIDQFEKNSHNKESELIGKFYTKTTRLTRGRLPKKEIKETTKGPFETKFSKNNDALRLFAFSKAIERIKGALESEVQDYKKSLNKQLEENLLNHQDYNKLLEKKLSEIQNYNKLFEIGQEAFENQVLWDDIYLGAAVVVGIVGCMVLSRGLVSFLCQGLIGLSGEGIFLWRANEGVEEAYEMLFQDVDGELALAELEALTDAEFDQVLAFAFTPLVALLPYKNASVGLKKVLKRIHLLKVRKSQHKTPHSSIL